MQRQLQVSLEAHGRYMAQLMGSDLAPPVVPGGHGHPLAHGAAPPGGEPLGLALPDFDAFAFGVPELPEQPLLNRDGGGATAAAHWGLDGASTADVGAHFPRHDVDGAAAAPADVWGLQGGSSALHGAGARDVVPPRDPWAPPHAGRHHGGGAEPHLSPGRGGPEPGVEGGLRVDEGDVLLDLHDDGHALVDLDHL